MKTTFGMGEALGCTLSESEFVAFAETPELCASMGTEHRYSLTF